MTLIQKIFWFVSLIVFPLTILFSPWLGTMGYILVGILSAYVLIGLHDLWFSRHTLNRLYPVVAYIRYGLEYIHPEIHQYFVASNIDELPFDREQRTLVYQRSKQVDDTLPFGTEYDITKQGWYGAMHSIAATTVKEEYKRVTIGSANCQKPYSASRFNCSAMSFGALGDTAIMALNKGAKLGNFYHNTGEGGFSSYHKQGGDIVWQIGTGYFGCRTLDGNFDPNIFKATAANDQIKMIEIKLSQGAKPSHGGVLPGAKVTKEIAEARLVAIGEDVISPPCHRTFSTPIGLLKFVEQLRELSGGKPTGFKLCIGHKHEFMAICKAMLESKIYPDFITIDGAEGGTGAAPIEFSNRLGLACVEAINFVNNCLIGVGLRDKITLIGSGKTSTGFDIIVKLAAGANIVNAARTMMFSLGCIQSQLCNTNRCPTGIATQDTSRTKALDVEEKFKRVANFQRLTLKSAFDLMGAMGIENPDNLSSHLIWRRDDNGVNQRFDHIYTQLKPNELLGDNIHAAYNEDWQLASADSFQPNISHAERNMK